MVGKPGLIGNNIGDTVTIALPTIGDGLMYIGVLHSYVTQLHTRVYPGKTQCRNTHIRTHTLPPTSFVHARTHANALTRTHHAPHTTHCGVVSYDRVGCMSAVLVVPSTSTIQCTGGIPTEEPEVSFVPAHLMIGYEDALCVYLQPTRAGEKHVGCAGLMPNMHRQSHDSSHDSSHGMRPTITMDALPHSCIPQVSQITAYDSAPRDTRWKPKVSERDAIVYMWR